MQSTARGCQLGWKRFEWSAGGAGLARFGGDWSGSCRRHAGAGRLASRLLTLKKDLELPSAQTPSPPGYPQGPRSPVRRNLPAAHRSPKFCSTGAARARIREFGSWSWEDHHHPHHLDPHPQPCRHGLSAWPGQSCGPSSSSEAQRHVRPNPSPSDSSPRQPAKMRAPRSSSPRPPPTPRGPP